MAEEAAISRAVEVADSIEIRAVARSVSGAAIVVADRSVEAVAEDAVVADSRQSLLTSKLDRDGIYLDVPDFQAAL